MLIKLLDMFPDSLNIYFLLVQNLKGLGAIGSIFGPKIKHLSNILKIANFIIEYPR